MDSTEVIAIAGIVGTIAGTAIGAGIAAWTTSRIEERRERREEKAEARKARAAARMIRADLVVSAATIDGILNKGMGDPGTMYLPVENWRGHGEHLALALEDGADRNPIELAMAGDVERLSTMKNNVPSGALTPAAREHLSNVHATLMERRQHSPRLPAIRPLSRPPTQPGRRTMSPLGETLRLW